VLALWRMQLAILRDLSRLSVSVGSLRRDAPRGKRVTIDVGVCPIYKSCTLSFVDTGISINVIGHKELILVIVLM